jgi:hypothetical protein
MKRGLHVPKKWDHQDDYVTWWSDLHLTKPDTNSHVYSSREQPRNNTRHVMVLLKPVKSLQAIHTKSIMWLGIQALMWVTGIWMKYHFNNILGDMKNVAFHPARSSCFGADNGKSSQKHKFVWGCWPLGYMDTIEYKMTVRNMYGRSQQLFRKWRWTNCVHFEFDPTLKKEWHSKLNIKWEDVVLKDLRHHFT